MGPMGSLCLLLLEQGLGQVDEVWVHELWKQRRRSLGLAKGRLPLVLVWGTESSRSLLQVLLVQKRPLLHKAVETALARWRVGRYLSVKGRHNASRRVQGSVC